MDAVGPPRPCRPGYLPFTYLEGFLKVLAASPRIRFLTLADLPFDRDALPRTEAGMKDFYRRELQAWQAQPAGEADLEVLLLHDCDSGPAETVHLCDHEARIGAVSTTSLFVDVPDRQGGIRPYGIDYRHLVGLQAQGQCFTYHCNGPELVGYDDARVPERINADVAALRAMGFEIDFFSPHGTRASPEGKSNTTYFYPPLFERPLIWTHNRFAPSGYRYSDGGFDTRLMRGDPSTDLRACLLDLARLPNPAAAETSWKARLKALTGPAATKRNMTRRIFILLHPQYYFAEDPRPAVMAAPDCPAWLSEFWQLHAQGRAADYWAPLAAALDRPAER